MSYKYLFGPVPSRRLGISLGIDLVPYKTCTLNCVYCECGRTTDLTIQRKEYVPTAAILSELDHYLRDGPELDYITFSGSGEPTLHSGLREIIDFLKTRYPKYRIAVLTNGTLLYDKKTRSEIMGADLIIPSLDAASEVAFKKINRPQKGLSLGRILSGLADLRKEFSGEIWLEVFIVPGLNDNEDELGLMKEAIDKIKPDKVQLNTLDRPGTEDWVMPEPKERMEEIASRLGAEVIADFKSRKKVNSFSEDTEKDIISTIRRRPCTASDLSEILGLHINEVNKYLQTLLESGRIRSEEGERGRFFRIN
jgi:wyosine [tRNA(Phe)-imidazoG37] synthetase (radical SAM superfamily)